VHHADHDSVLRWSEHGLQRVLDGPVGELLAADSWLVEDGAVRGYDAHWARFAGWCDELGVQAGELAGFRSGVTAALPRAGRWFPRVELVAGAAGEGAGAGAGAAPTEGPGRLRLRLRPAPPAEREARVIVAPAGDPRTRPRRKGPDLELLLALRAQAVAGGADELLLCDDEGRVLEGALASLLWWEDGTLCTTPDEGTLPGVTRALLLAITRERGVPVRVRSPLPDELAGCETWLTNALHGIRVVSWAPGSAGAARHHALWQAELDGTARRLEDP
jgi:branched-subunit amino acid aminotransferase/4-amino-4-deoxychorismate lyase